jgi:hypothetical protein
MLLYRLLLYLPIFTTDRWHAMTQRRYARYCCTDIKKCRPARVLALYCIAARWFIHRSADPSGTANAVKTSKQKEQQSCDLHSNKPTTTLFCSGRKMSTDTYLLHMNSSSGFTDQFITCCGSSTSSICTQIISCMNQRERGYRLFTLASID